METTRELLTGGGDRNNAERAAHQPSDSVASLLPGQQPGAESDCARGHGVAHQLTNVAAIMIPLAAFVLAVVMLWGPFIEWIDLAVLAVGYVTTCLGITVGFHRLLIHRSFQTYPAVRYALAVLGTLAVEGSVIKRVADHRKHHVFTDQEGDPHSPHEAGPGVAGALSGLWHAHIGWLFNSVGQAARGGWDLAQLGGQRALHAGGDRASPQRGRGGRRGGRRPRGRRSLPGSVAAEDSFLSPYYAIDPVYMGDPQIPSTPWRMSTCQMICSIPDSEGRTTPGMSSRASRPRCNGWSTSSVRARSSSSRTCRLRT